MSALKPAAPIQDQLPADLHRRPFDPSRTSIAARQAEGHLNRVGHRLTGLYVSRDGTVWHLWRTCCEEPVPLA